MQVLPPKDTVTARTHSTVSPSVTSGSYPLPDVLYLWCSVIWRPKEGQPRERERERERESAWHKTQDGSYKT
jgi:hypothetical protein